MPPEFPARIGPYDVVGVIGAGRLGTVYKAFDEAHARVVGIRVLSPDLLADAPRLERFRRAARALAAIVHDNLLRTLDEGQDGYLVYTVTEYVDGCALFDRLQSSRLTLAEAIHVLHGVADGLGAAMMVKIDIEDRRALREFDPVIGKGAPASVQTKRLLTQRAPQHPTAEAALWQLGESYDDMKQYALAVQAYVQLATRFPNTRLDAWFKAGEITERRLKNRDDARAAYLRVPPTSARYQDAQDRAKKLAGR